MKSAVRLNDFQWKATGKLIRLIKDRPELPVVFYVDSEVVEDPEARSSWIGEIADVSIRKLWMGDDDYYNTVYEKDDVYDDYEFAEKYAPKNLKDKWEGLNDDDYFKAINEFIDSLDWALCIAVEIGTPDKLMSNSD